jgi:hypothetical protein
MPLTVVLGIALAMTAQTRRVWEEKGDFGRGVDLSGGGRSSSISIRARTVTLVEFSAMITAVGFSPGILVTAASTSVLFKGEPILVR